jgi:2-dehydropantoate 2-reductase
MRDCFRRHITEFERQAFNARHVTPRLYSSTSNDVVSQVIHWRESMKVLVLGAGAIGGYYGARLIEAGADVTFAVRGARRQAIESNGLRVESALGDFDARVEVVGSEHVDGKYDLVLLACKAYDIDPAIGAIAQTVDAGAVVLPFLNGLGAYDLLDRRFGRERVLGGVSYIATTLLDDSTIRHAGDADTVIVGARHAAHHGVARQFHNLIARTPGRRVLSENIDQALWDKWVMISAATSICCLMRGTVGEIASTTEGASLISLVIHECEQVARQSGFELSRDAINQIIGRLLDRDSIWAPSMMRDIEAGTRRLEADAIVGDMAARAHALGIPAVLTRAAHTNLQIYVARGANERPRG